MKRVLRVAKDVNTRRARVKELMSLDLSELEMDVKLQLIQALIPLGLMHVGEVLQEQVRVLAGDWYQRNGVPGHVRWANCIESLMALIGQRTDKVDYWKNSDQKQRWLATALLDI
ncbi:MAG: hypothetical protein JRI46_08320, partial [Deltaproteobacteria bacterium]|nr:hypothetical protein [Deltaproteobacteria bacterium]